MKLDLLVFNDDDRIEKQKLRRDWWIGGWSFECEQKEFEERQTEDI